MPHVSIEILLWLFGLSIGSFLNVLVFRLPRGWSVAAPRWSFCPHCAGTIAWYDNIPLLSWWWLGGRCRRCAAPISVQYPLIESLTGLAFVTVYHLLFVAQTRAGLPMAHLPADLPLLVAWLILVAVLIACAAMDIVSYMIDTRITDVALASGVVLHAIWPRSEFVTASAANPFGAAAVAAFIAGAAMLWSSTGEEGEEPAPADGNRDGTVEKPPPGTVAEGSAAAGSENGGDRTVAEGPGDALANPASTHASRRVGSAGSLLMAAAAATLIVVNVLAPVAAFATYVIAASGVLAFLLIVLAGAEPRTADAEIHAAVESERPLARRRTGAELLWLAPAVLAAVLGWGVVSQQPMLKSGWQELVSWQPVAGWAPIAGAIFSIEGVIAGAAAGWVLRVVFTLIFGREAFGVGDIFILSAAGAVVGWDLVLLGLALAVVIALVGWFAGLVVKNSAMIPFGPWLGLGFVTALWSNRIAERVVEHYRLSFVQTWETEPRILLILVGLMLVGGAASVALASLLRRWLGGPPPTLMTSGPGTGEAGGTAIEGSLAENGTAAPAPDHDPRVDSSPRPAESAGEAAPRTPTRNGQGVDRSTDL